MTEFAHDLHPSLADAVRRWRTHPSLRKLHAALTAHSKRKVFLDACAEAVVARHFEDGGCDVVFEVPTPTGRAADFEVRHADEEGDPLYVHVKRLNTSRPLRRRLTISSRLRYLERIERPFVVKVRWLDDIDDGGMQRLVESAAGFLRHATVGDELVVHDDGGREIGGVLVVAPWDGSHVSIAIGLPTGFVDEAPRLRKLLRRAYKQFMPRAANLILLATSDPEDHKEVEMALLGAHVERWDAFPQRGRRIAYGRAGDGFWHGRRYVDSQVVGWFRLDPLADEVDITWWFREDPPASLELKARVERLFRAG